jgi:2-dehydro-3-deoxyphosphooctonate aldolase (KDO 8-P synthase)
VTSVRVGSFDLSNSSAMSLIAGPCQLETLDHSLMIAEHLLEVTAKLNIPFIFKGSFDKANRSSVSGKRGVGFENGLEILSQVRSRLGIPVLTDIHEIDQCVPAAQAVDVLQIPAFLCRQTDLLLAAANTNAVVNVKKGQFLAPWDMKNVVEKLESTGNRKIILTERGVSFGYNTLVTDLRALSYLKKTGYPVVFDATHSVQQPGGQGTSSGGERIFAPLLARAAVSTGIAAVFIETHQDPDTAPSDGANMIPLNEMSDLIKTLYKFDELAKQHPLQEI